MTIPAPFEPAPTLSLSDDMLQAADELYPYTSDSALKAVSDLRERFSQEESARILNLVQARTKGEAKFGDYARELMLTEHGVEQASRPVIARYHAEILKAAGASVVADIGCGIGADSMGFARNGLSTVSIEMDPETASYTAHNLRRFGHVYRPSIHARSPYTNPPDIIDRKIHLQKDTPVIDSNGGVCKS